MRDLGIQSYHWYLRVSAAVMKYHVQKNKLEGNLAQGRNLEAGADAEAMEG